MMEDLERKTQCINSYTYHAQVDKYCHNAMYMWIVPHVLIVVALMNMEYAVMVTHTFIILLLC